MATKKIRLDQIILDRGLAESKTRAQALVMAGVVFIGDVKAQKPGQQIAEDTEISVRGSDCKGEGGREGVCQRLQRLQVRRKEGGGG